MVDGAPLEGAGALFHDEVGGRRPPDAKMLTYPPQGLIEGAICSFWGVLNGKRHLNLEFFLVEVAEVDLRWHFIT